MLREKIRLFKSILYIGCLKMICFFIVVFQFLLFLVKYPFLCLFKKITRKNECPFFWENQKKHVFLVIFWCFSCFSTFSDGWKPYMCKKVCFSIHWFYIPEGMCIYIFLSFLGREKTRFLRFFQGLVIIFGMVLKKPKIGEKGGEKVGK